MTTPTTISEVQDKVEDQRSRVGGSVAVRVVEGIEVL
jgi:hypothetical protein